MTPEVRPASVGQRVLAYAGLLIGLVACGAAFWMDVQRVRTLGMDTAPPSWVVDAIPPALSAYLFGHRVRYTSLVTVHTTFTQGMQTLPGGVQAAMAEVAKLDPATVGTEYRLLGPDDKGIVDFVEAALWIFGLRMEGITWLYLLVTLVSASALLIAEGGSRAVMLWLVGFLLAHALLMPMVRLNPQLGSYLALRAMPVISMIACFHLLVFVLRPSTRPLDLLLLTLQALLIVLAVHIRVTAQWQIVAVGLVTVVVGAVRLYRGRGPSIGHALRRAAPVGLPLALLALGMVGLQVYRSVAYPAEY